MQDAGTGVNALQILPAHAPAFAFVGDHAVTDFRGETVARFRTGLQQDVMLLRITEPGAKDVLLLLPQHFARPGIKGDDAVILRQIVAATLQQFFRMGGELVEAVDAAVTRDDAVVQEAVPRLYAPEHSTAVPVKDGKARTGGVILDRRGGAALGGAGLQAEMREVIAAEEQIVQNADEGPLRGIIGLLAQLDRLLPFPSARVEHLAFSFERHINHVLRGDVVRAAPVGAGDVLLVVGRAQRRVLVGFIVVDAKGAEVFEIVLPENATGVHIACADAVHPFDEKPPAHHLLGRSVAVAWKDVHVRTAAEPQHAERRPHAVVVGFHRVADVAILMRPVRRTGQGALTNDEVVSAELFDLRILQPARIHWTAAEQDPAVGTHGRVGGGKVLVRRDDEIREVRRSLKRQRVPGVKGDTRAVNAPRIVFASQFIDFLDVRLHHGDLHLRLEQQRIDQRAIFRAKDQRMAARISCLVEQCLRELQHCGHRCRELLRLRFEAPDAFASAINLNAAIHGHRDQLAVRGEQTAHLALHRQAPSDGRLPGQGDRADAVFARGVEMIARLDEIA